MGVFAKNGFRSVAEKINLGRFVLDRMNRSGVENLTPAERMRLSFEELGPTFVKLGQLLATRPDLVPSDFVDEFKKLHDQVSALPFGDIRKVIEGELGCDLHETFEVFEPLPLGAASIAQVHRATLKNGEAVVVKVQRPGIVETIQQDVGILYFIADLLEKYAPETRAFNPVGIVDEFFKTLELETNFIIEANNIRRVSENFRNESSIKIPQVYLECSTRRILVLEALQGIPLSNRAALLQEGIDREKFMNEGLRCYLKMVFKDGLFHGDLHAGNLFVMADGRIGLIDFGIVGRLNRKSQNTIANMFVALYTEDYERMAYEYVELAPFNDRVDLDRFAKDLRDLLAPYFGLSTKNVDFGKLLMESTAIAARYHLVMPSELMLFFKSIVTVEGMGRLVLKDFDFLAQAMAFASELVKTRYEPERVKEDLLYLARDSASLLAILPKQLKQMVRKINHPDFSLKHKIHGVDELKRSVETGSNIIFLGFVIGSLILSASILQIVDKEPKLLNLPFMSAISYGLAVVLSAVAFYNYIRK